MRDISPALLRFFGSLGFGGISVGTYLIGNSKFHLQLEAANGFADFGTKGITLVIVSTILGLIGMFIGWQIAVSIPVRSDRTDYIISTIWHYMANGFLTWVFMFSLFLTYSMGQDAKEWVKSIGSYSFCAKLFIIPTLGSIACGVALITTGLLRFNRTPYFLPSMMVVCAIMLATGHALMSTFQLDNSAWIVMSIIIAIFLVPINVYMVERDFYQKSQIQQ